MREVVWKCDWCKEGESHCEEMPRYWNIKVIKVWDGTEVAHPNAYIGKKIFHFCSEDCASNFLAWHKYEKH